MIYNRDMDRDRSKESYKAKFYGFILFSFFAGLYLVPEYIKLISIAFTCLLLVSVLFNATEKHRISPTFFLWSAFCVLGLLVFAIYGVGNFSDSLEFVISILIGLLAQLFFITPKTRNTLLIAIGAVSVVAVIGCVLQIIVPELLMKINAITLGADKYKLFYDFYSWGRLVGFSYQTGVTGYYLGIFSGFVLCDLLFNKNNGKLKKLILLVSFVVSYVFILFTAKRSVLLLVAGLTYLFLCYYYKKHLLKIVGFTICIAVGVVSLLMFTEMGRDLLERTVGSGALSGRDKIYSQLWVLIKEKPILGHGFGSTLALIKDFTNGHNIYLQVLSENGILGLLLLVSILIFNLRCSFILMKRVQDKEKRIVAVCIYLQCFFILMGLIGNPLYDVYPLIIYMVAAGITQSMYYESRKKV